MLRIGTYNVRNLASPQGGTKKERRREEKRLVALGKVIRDAVPDIVALQEVGDVAVLEQLDREVLRQQYPHRHVALGNSPRGLGLAVLSRVPWTRVQSHAGVPLLDDDGATLCDAAGQAVYFRRDVLRLDIPYGAADESRSLVLFLVHFKSALSLAAEGLGLSCDAYRRAEARTTAALISEFMASQPQSNVVVLGDFNGEAGQGSSLAPLCDGLGFFDPLQHEFPNRADRWTATWKAYGRFPFDFMLLSPAAESAYREGSATVHRGIPADRASDHRLVTLDLEL